MFNGQVSPEGPIIHQNILQTKRKRQTTDTQNMGQSQKYVEWKKVHITVFHLHEF